MSFIYVLRHAKAEKQNVTDHARQLSEKGDNQALALSAWLVQSGITFEKVIASDSARTRETLDLLELASDIAVVKQAYNADARTLTQLIRESGAQESVLVIAHNPGVSDLCAEAGNDFELRTCELVILDCPSELSEFSPEKCAVVGKHRPEVED